MRIISLNIKHGGGSRAGRILEYLLSTDADAMVISEYRSNANGQMLRRSLGEHGYECTPASSADPRLNSVTICARHSFETLPLTAGLETNKQRVQCARFPNFVLAGVYFPLKQAKRPVYDYLLDSLVPSMKSPLLMIGDFNTGRHHVDEAGATFHCAEQFVALEERSGLIDTWRSRNPDVREFSWISTSGNRYRIDHALASPDFDQQIQSVRYDHSTRAGLTDHSALIVDCAFWNQSQTGTLRRDR